MKLERETGLKSVAAVLLFFLILVPRVIGLDRFITVDESTWVTISANYYYALSHFQFANTIYNYHPGVTTMWIGLVGMLVDFPAYRGLGQGYLDEDHLTAFLISHGHQPVELLVTSRLVQVFVIAILMLVVYFLLNRLAGRLLAFSAVALVAVDPYFLGNSRLLNHEAMLAQFSLISILALLVYLYRDKHWFYLLLSGVAAALANLTKSSAIVLIPLIGLILLVNAWQSGLRAGFWLFARRFLVWLVLIVAAYVLFWPGMWVAPEKMLGDVYGNAFGYAISGVPEMYTGQIPVQQTDRLSDTITYFAGILWRTTPVVWIGLGLAIAALFNSRQPFLERFINLIMMGLAVAFITLFGVASGRNSAHYVLTSYVAFDVSCAVGLCWALQLLGARFARLQGTAARWGIVAAVVAVQLLGCVGQFPYYYTYSNPLMAALFPGQNPNYGYGEVFEQAAVYLSAKKDAGALTVMSWYARGPLTYFFPGRVKNIKLLENLDRQMLDDIRQSDYLVIFYASQKRRNMPANLMHVLGPIPPERTIWFNNIEYVRIYKVGDLPASFYSALP